MHIFISIMSISSPNPMLDHLLESSHRDDSNKWSNIGFCEEIRHVQLIEVHFTHHIWSSDYRRILFHLLPFYCLCSENNDCMRCTCTTINHVFIIKDLCLVSCDSGNTNLFLECWTLVISLNPLQPGIQNGRLENVVWILLKMSIFGSIFEKL